MERRKRTRKKDEENPDWGKGAGSERDAQRWKLGDTQGLSAVIVQKGHCEHRNPQNFLPKFPRTAVTSLPGWKLRARKGGVGEQGSVK